MADVAMGSLKGPRGNGTQDPRVVDGNLLFTEVRDGLTSTKNAGNVRGPQGLPGVNAVSNDEAIAAYMKTPGTSATKTALQNAIGGDYITAAELGVDQTGATATHVSLQAALDLAASLKKRLKTAGQIRLGAPIKPSSGGFWDGGNATTVFATTAISSAIGNPDSNLSGFTVSGVSFVGGRKVDNWLPTELPRRSTTNDSVKETPSFTSAIALTGHLTPGFESNPVISDFKVINCDFSKVGGLPVLFRGVTRPRVYESRFEWTMDPGFTFCPYPEFSRNLVRNGTDNGVSLSRGCTFVQCHDNTFENVAYYGMWFGGWEGDGGPDGVNATGNTIRRVGRAFVFLGDGATNAVITGNNGSVALNGPVDVPSNNMGVAVQVSGLLGGKLARNILIIGNQFSDCYRGGVHLVDVVDVMIIGNQFINMGGNPSAPGNSQTHNNGVFIDRRSDSNPVLSPPSAHASRVLVSTNTFLDNRTPVITNSPVTNDVQQSLGYQGFMNYIPRPLRNEIGESFRVGGSNPPVGVATNFILNSAPGEARDLVFSSLGVRRWDMRVSGAESSGNLGSNLRLTRRADDGTVLGSPLVVTRSTGDTQVGEVDARMGFFGKTPVTKPAVTANPTNAGETQNALGVLLNGLESLGLVRRG